jgi:hypothetical protein
MHGGILFRILPILIVGVIWINTLGQVAGGPELTRILLTPRSGTTDDTYMFIVTYKSAENMAPDFVQLVIDNKRYDLEALNEGDLNYTDGKDYIIKVKVSKGTHLYYLETSDGNQTTSSLASTLIVREENQFTHLDVAYSVLFATFIILIPMIYGLYLLKKLVDKLDKLEGKDSQMKERQRKK